MNRPARRAAIIAGGAALAACGTIGVAAAAPGSATTARATATATATATAARTVRYYAFNINNGSNDPGLVPVPGTNPKVFSQGDELIINDQLTSTHRAGRGYPIVGYDSGVCTFTRVPEKYAKQTLADCVVTAVWKSRGSLTMQGVIRFKSHQPDPAVLAITSGTGSFGGAAGTMRVSFTKNYKILTIAEK